MAPNLVGAKRLIVVGQKVRCFYGRDGGRREMDPALHHVSLGLSRSARLLELERHGVLPSYFAFAGFTDCRPNMWLPAPPRPPPPLSAPDEITFDLPVKADERLLPSAFMPEPPFAMILSPIPQWVTQTISVFRTVIVPENVLTGFPDAITRHS
jgi:hypothetical protein